jgi:PIN domain nuclease of toxin-antitoxin system
MKLLLDTHIWLWSLLEPKHLSRRVAKALVHPNNEIWISPVSAWEILLLGAKGRLNVKRDGVKEDGDINRWVERILSRTSFREAPLTNEVVMAMQKTDLPHRDTADRFLAATAAAFGLTLVTADENLIRGAGYSVLANQ